MINKIKTQFVVSRWLPTEELVPVVTDNMLDDDLSLDWTIRHGRSALVAVALKEAPVTIYSEEWAPKVIRVILAHLVADRVPIASNGGKHFYRFFR